MLTKEQTERWDAWVAALESGEFVQAQYYLKTIEGAMCCLGVACHLAGAPSRVHKGGHAFSYFDQHDSCTLIIPKSVQYLYGFESIEGIYLPGGVLAELNDITFDPNKPDYSNVLPEIKKYLAKNRWVDAADSSTNGVHPSSIIIDDPH